MRSKIALRNLLISQAIILLFLVFAYFVWFPHSFTQLGGFNKTALMLIFVDLVLGPLLVFIVYKEGKKYLAFDINVLLSIQLIAFIFGAYSLFLKHPAYAVFSDDRFILTNVSSLYPRQDWSTQLTSSFFSSPKLVYAKTPDDPRDKSKLIVEILLKRAPDINNRPKYYEPLEQHVHTVFSKSIDLNTLLLNEEIKEKLSFFLIKHGGVAEDYAYFPLQGNNQKKMIWVFNRSEAEPVGIIDSNS